MRTWLALAAVLVVAAAAVADSLHGGLRESEASPTPTVARRIVPPGVPAGFMGSVFYSDPHDGCRLHSLSLPGFTSAPPPKFRSCRFSLSPDGERAAAHQAAWSPLGGLVAVPRGAAFDLEVAEGRRVRVRGSAPSFKPDGSLTYVRAGELVEWSVSCRPGDRLFTLPGDNATARCIRPLLRPARLRSLAWLSDTRLAAVTEGGALVVYDGPRRLLRRPLPGSGDARLEASPRRTFFTLWSGDRLLAAFDRDGAQITLPPLPRIRAVAWSPSERWAVLATGSGSVYIFRPDTGDARLRRLDITARDLAWR
jgi:hypothetical protein